MSTTVTIGSDETCDFPIAFNGVSSLHCRVIFDDGEVWVEDLDSTNGTFVNEQRVDPGERKRLSPSSELSLGGQATFTWEDLQALRPSSDASPQGKQPQGMSPTSDFVPADGYAGFWRRWAASLIDGLVLYVIGLVLGLLVIVLFAGGVRRGMGGLGFPELVILYILGFLEGWIYFAAFEASEYQATLGKMAIGIKVTNADGEQIGFWRATGRHFGKIVSSIILLVGYLMAGITEKKQALHDMMADCLVVNDIEHPNRRSRA